MQNNKMTQDTKPMARLMQQGPSALCDAELVALMLCADGHAPKKLKLAQSLLSRFGGLANLMHATPSDLTAHKGISAPSVAKLCAVLELSKRVTCEQLKARTAFSDPSMVKSYMQLHIAQKPHEVFMVMFLDSQTRLITMEQMFRGTISQTSVYPKEVVLQALHHKASAVIFSHNHPSGSVEPSRADIALTQTLRAALNLVDVRVLDHIIVAPGIALSMAEKGLM